MSQLDKFKQYKVGQVVNAVSAELDEGKTSPPSRYTESSLINDMENANKFVKNEEERALLRETEGIGTARTRGTTLSGLVRRKLLTSKKVGRNYEIRSSDIAKDMIGKLPSWLKDVATTAKWEMLLGKIEKNEVNSTIVLDSQKAQIEQIVKLARQQAGKK